MTEGPRIMLLRCALFLLTTAGLIGLPAQAYAQGGPDAFGYSWDPTPFDWVDPGNGGSSLPITVDDQELVVALPWSFFFYGTAYDYLSVSDNGALRFGDGSSAANINFGNATLPSSGSSDADIAVFWDDLNISSAGGVAVHHQTTTDRFIISWVGLPHFSYGGAVSFQVHLQPSGHIEFHYLDTEFGSASVDAGASATVGIQDLAGGTSLAGNVLDLSSFSGTVLPQTGYSIASPCTDADGDGHAALGDVACSGTDCDDTNSAIYPGASEVCADGIDQNCSGYDLLTDFDQDGDLSLACGGADCDDFDNSRNSLIDADADGFVACDDCDDGNASVNPSAPEICDGNDNDCDDLGDDLTDADGDGATLCDGDCDDGDATSLPGAPEICGDGNDNDCDGSAENLDADGDTYIAAACGGLDCDDTDTAVSPDALELCDGIDSDCDGNDDAFDLDVGSSSTPFTVVNQVPVVLDASTSGTTVFTSEINVISAAGSALEDVEVSLSLDHTWVGDLTLSLSSPSGTSILLSDRNGGDGDNYTSTTFDDDAAGSITTASPPFTGSYQPEGSLSTFFGSDLIGVWTLTVVDNFPTLDDGTILSWSLAGSAIASDDSDVDGAVDGCGDCDAGDANIYPGASEVCGDGVDQDCSGADLIDDIDGDGVSAVDCGGTDCDDTNSAIFPGADFDGDGVGACDDDCDDADSSVYPAAVETCDDGVDQDCDGSDLLADADGDGETGLACGGTDCDDQDAAVGNASPDLFCDGLDLNCDGFDLDGDGDGDPPEACGGGDCDDADSTSSSLSPEICDGNDVDNDCDGLADAWDLDIDALPLTMETLAGATIPAVISDTLAAADVVTSSHLGGVFALSVTVDITHVRVGDLTLSLEAPSGQVVALATEVGGLGANYSGTTFEDTGVDGPIASGTAPFTGDFVPEESLAALTGQPVAGDWTLHASDGYSGGDGLLNSWSLSITILETADYDFDGSVNSCGDCDDANAAIYPGALEVCSDGIDQNCDGIDQLSDVDGDGWDTVLCGGADCDDTFYNTSPDALEACDDGVDNDCNPATLDIFDGDADGSPCTVDCDDNDPLSFPGFIELCSDGQDNDCDLTTLDTGDSDGDGVNCTVDCDDSNPGIYPGAPELLCTGVEEDCSAVINPDVSDGDGDGSSCVEDCDDTSASTYPGALEIPCDGIDNDCDAIVDLDDGMNNDVDGDGSTCDLDCDDNDPLRSPGFAEICEDLIDNDCDLATDDEPDADGDGFNCTVDCDDSESTTFPGAPEICDDNVDQDCDNLTDELAADAYVLGDSDSLHIGICSFEFPFCGSDWSELYVQDNGRVTFGFDDPSSQEGLANFLSQVPQIAMLWTDLDPSIAGSVTVTETEGLSLAVEFTAVPQFGDAGTANSFTLTLWNDGMASISYGAIDAADGFVGFACGDQNLTSLDLSAASGVIGQGTEDAVYEQFSALGAPNDLQGSDLDLCLSAGTDTDSDGWTNLCGDCDDGDANRNPGVEEACDGLDNNCNGAVDDVDADGDGFIASSCFGTDCDDDVASVYPGATELCNSIDDDCDGLPEEDGTDFDLDGYLLCEGDCDDGNNAVYPGAEEICDLDAFGQPLDNDCNGEANEGFEMDLDEDGYISDECGGDDCSDQRASSHPGAEEICDLVDNDCDGEADNIDEDGDGYSDADCSGDDCDDADDEVHPGMQDTPYDGVDSDCSGADLTDVDGDGYSSDEVPGGLDCDDSDSAMNPTADELCDDGRDNDCDGLQDIDDEECGACADCASNIGPVSGSEHTLPLLGLLLGALAIRRRRRRPASA